jgi:hypothetical protein
MAIPSKFTARLGNAVLAFDEVDAECPRCHEVTLHRSVTCESDPTEAIKMTCLICRHEYSVPRVAH